MQQLYNNYAREKIAILKMCFKTARDLMLKPWQRKLFVVKKLKLHYHKMSTSSFLEWSTQVGIITEWNKHSSENIKCPTCGFSDITHLGISGTYIMWVQMKENREDDISWHSPFDPNFLMYCSCTYHSQRINMDNL